MRQRNENCSVSLIRLKTVAPQNVTERTRKAKSIEVQLISQIRPQAVLSGIFC